MQSKITGDPNVLAIEWKITTAQTSLSQLALGFFNIHVAGQRYGVRKIDATMMGCSYNEVKERILRSGSHLVSFATEPATKIALAIRTALYENMVPNSEFFGMNSAKFKTNLYSRKIIWAPDGDAAFDDGGHVLQFDLAEKVRIVAFKNAVEIEDIHQTVSEITLESSKFYHLLENWISEFEAERTIALGDAA